VSSFSEKLNFTPLLKKKYSVMWESNEPQFNVDKLMQQIREEVAMDQKLDGWGEEKTDRIPTTLAGHLSCVEPILNDAEFQSEVPTKWPDKLNRFPFNISKRLQRFFLKLHGFIFKKQRVVNFALIQALRESLVQNQQLIDQVNALQSQLNEMSDRFTAIEEPITGIENRLTATEEQLQGMSDRFTATEERLVATQKQVNELGNRTIATDERVSEICGHFTATEERQIRNDNYLKNDLAQQKRLINLFLEEARKRLPEPFSQEQLQTFTDEEHHSLDAFYAALENQFRGTREEIHNKLKVYLPLIEEAKVGTQEAPILDIGCGRGEWLELMREHGDVARGIDINRVTLDECRARGLEVREKDAIAYLRSLPDASLGAVTGFHIIEHLPFEMLVELFTETARVLKPGGLVIFETPNPQNVIVGSYTFYLDPTHRHPLPSALVKFLAEFQGLYQVRIMNLHPRAEQARVESSELAERFNNYFYSSQDYSIVGYKA
jgi:O-antigen chain-terminating methyltransferase